MLFGEEFKIDSFTNNEMRFHSINSDRVKLKIYVSSITQFEIYENVSFPEKKKVENHSCMKFAKYFKILKEKLNFPSLFYYAKVICLPGCLHSVNIFIFKVVPWVNLDFEEETLLCVLNMRTQENLS